MGFGWAPVCIFNGHIVLSGNTHTVISSHFDHGSAPRVEMGV